MSTIFFTDRDLGKKFPRILREHGIPVEVHHDHFRHDTPDVEWLAEVGRRGWYAISHNARIQYTPLEHRAVVMGGVGLFIVVGKSTSAAWAEGFVRAYGAVQGFIARHQRPFIARVYQDGRVLRFYPDRERF